LELRPELKRLREPELSVEPRYRLSLSLSAEAAWWLHAAQAIYERLEGSAPRAALFEALLAEATAELCPDNPTPNEVEQLECEAAWRSQLAQWRLQAERACERLRGCLESRAGEDAELEGGQLEGWVPRGQLEALSVEQLDARLVRLARQLRQRDLELGRLAMKLRRHEVWRRLGFASEAHYCRERLGLGRSSL